MATAPNELGERNKLTNLVGTCGRCKELGANSFLIQVEYLGLVFRVLGLCVRVIVEFCIDQAPYNYSRFPSRLHVSQTYAAQVEAVSLCFSARCMLFLFFRGPVSEANRL